MGKGVGINQKLFFIQSPEEYVRIIGENKTQKRFVIILFCRIQKSLYGVFRIFCLTCHHPGKQKTQTKENGEETKFNHGWVCCCLEQAIDHGHQNKCLGLFESGQTK